VYEGSIAEAAKAAAYFPVNDPLVLIPALAAVTEHLGFGVTYNVSFEPPYTLARRLSTIDHLSSGRVAWNIVTGVLDTAAAALGNAAVLDHDERYDMADEYMEVVYRLWEESWEDGAVVRDRERRIYARPDKLHKIRHHGKYFKIEAYHLCEPSPQRTPLLYQAGGSERGRRFGARHGECIFVNGVTTSHVREKVADIRRAAAREGRGKDDLLFFMGAAVIVGENEAHALRKLRDYQEAVSIQGNLAAASALSGIDFSKQPVDKPVEILPTNTNRSVMPSWASGQWTPERISTHLGGRGRVIIGDPKTVCDEMQRWIQETGVDGFNLYRLVTPESLEDFVDLVVPELQRRGVVKRQYAPGTLRDKLFRRSAYLPPNHPGAVYRHPSQ
jgi:FMN-dependent oxidoreductase (nitrilotriacetate monooxygenase family)